MSKERKEIKKLLKENGLAHGIEQTVGFFEKVWRDYRSQLKFFGIGVVILIIIIFSYVNHSKSADKDALKVFDGIQIYYRNGRYEDSLSEAKSLLNKYSSSKWAGYAAYYAANCYFNMGQYDEAIKSFELALSKRLPIWIKGFALSGLAKTQESKGEIDKAIETYKKVLDKSSYEFLKPEAMISIGKCYETKQNFPEAQRYYQEVMAKYSGFPQAAKAREYNDLLTNQFQKTNIP